MAESTFVYVSYIRTTPERLWHSLTTADVITQYWFGMRAEGGWETGSKWRLYHNEQLMDSGEILESVPGKRLVRSWLNEWKPEFKAEGLSRCLYEMEQIGDALKLTVTHSIDHSNSAFIAAVSTAWPLTISNLKSLLETGKIAVLEHPGH